MLKIDNSFFMPKGYAQKKRNHLMLETRHSTILDNDLAKIRVWILLEDMEVELGYFEMTISMYMTEMGEKFLAVNIYWETLDTGEIF